MIINIAECSEVTKTLIRQLIARDAHGKAKYGVTLDRKDLTPQQWLQHMTEELLDGAGYAQATLREIDEQLNVTVVTDPAQMQYPPQFKIVDGCKGKVDHQGIFWCDGCCRTFDTKDGAYYRCEVAINAK